MATKSLNFNIETIDRLRELFPDYANGNMSAATLGEELVNTIVQIRNEQVHDLVPQPANDTVNEEYEHLRTQYEELQNEHEALNQKNEQERTEYQALRDEYDRLQETLNTLNENYSQSQSSESELKESLKSAESRLKELKAQLKAATAESETYAFTPYFKQLIAVVAEKINAVSGTAYSPTDVIMQTLFATYFNSHTSIRYTYPISKAELLALAQQFYPELQSEKELFELMIYKVKEEQA